MGFSDYRIESINFGENQLGGINLIGEKCRSIKEFVLSRPRHLTLFPKEFDNVRSGQNLYFSILPKIYDCVGYECDEESQFYAQEYSGIGGIWSINPEILELKHLVKIPVGKEYMYHIDDDINALNLDQIAYNLYETKINGETYHKLHIYNITNGDDREVSSKLVTDSKSYSDLTMYFKSLRDVVNSAGYDLPNPVINWTSIYTGSNAAITKLPYIYYSEQIFEPGKEIAISSFEDYLKSLGFSRKSDKDTRNNAELINYYEKGPINCGIGRGIYTHADGYVTDKPFISISCMLGEGSAFID